MDVRNCRGCGRLFNYFSGPPICQACREKLEEKFQQVKEYLRDNPNSSIQAVSDDNEVSVAQIRQWVREERLTFSDDSPIGIPCESCGKTIKTGRFCDECKGKMKNDFSSMIKKPQTAHENPKNFHKNDKRRIWEK